MTAAVIGLMPVAAVVGGGVWFQSWAQRGARQQGGHDVSRVKYHTPHQLREIRAAERRRPSTIAEVVEVHDTMRAVLGADPERFENAGARAVYLLDETRLRAGRTETT